MAEHELINIWQIMKEKEADHIFEILGLFYED